METDQGLSVSLQEDASPCEASIRAFRELVAEVVPQGFEFDRAAQVRLQAKAKAQDYLKWLRQRQGRKGVRR
jgi:hypothetical protein